MLQIDTDGDLLNHLSMNADSGRLKHIINTYLSGPAASNALSSELHDPSISRLF